MDIVFHFDAHMDFVYYHGACPDGWAAAYIAKMKYPKAELIPLSYGAFDYEAILEQVRDKKALMVDFSMKSEEENDKLALAAKFFHIFDHHKSAKAIIGNRTYATFDMERSGAGLTWDYLFGYGAFQATGVMNVRPWWVNYTEDQDLWRFKLPNSREINAWLNIQERTPERWKQIAFMPRYEKEAVPTLGKAIQEQIAYQVKWAMHDLQEGVWEFEGRNYRVGIVNNGHVGTSEIGEAIYNSGYDIAIMWREDGRGMTRFGLRSKVADVGKMAATFPGGGGHAASAGFELSIRHGRAFIDTILGRK